MRKLLTFFLPLFLFIVHSYAQDGAKIMYAKLSANGDLRVFVTDKTIYSIKIMVGSAVDSSDLISELYSFADFHSLGTISQSELKTNVGNLGSLDAYAKITIIPIEGEAQKISIHKSEL